MVVKRRRVLGIVLAALSVTGCVEDPLPGQDEERPVAEQDVPAQVRIAAAKACARLGRATVTAWAWDTEDDAWEMQVEGLSRQAELDLNPDGSFSELELVYGFDEVAALLPEVAENIRSKCHTDQGLLIELSLRREEYLDSLPGLGEAWRMDGVVLEFQGPGRADYELDARGMLVKHPVDDAASGK